MCTISNVLIHLVLGTSFTDDSFAGNRPAPAAYLTITQSYQLHSRVLSILSPSLPLSTSSIVMVFTRSYSMWAASLLGSRIKGNLIISYPKIFFFTHLLEKNEKKKEKKNRKEEKRREEKRRERRSEHAQFENAGHSCRPAGYRPLYKDVQRLKRFLSAGDKNKHIK